ncbi:hypothetical protein B0H13DRAFT_1851575 [Mycena leptocephala]|nr:hypothetical protein B0H13DRAFT_1851575 [Mycena leptocephala]
MISDGARRLSSSLLSAALGEADSPLSDDEHGQNAAKALENAIFTAAAGDLPAYQHIFRHIYLDLKTQRIEIQVIGRGGFTARFSLRRRSKISQVRAAVAQLFDDPTARFFWPSVNHFQEEPGLENVVRPGYALLVVHGEPRDGHIVVVHEIVTTTAHSKPSKSTFGVAPTYTLESLRKFFLPGYKQLLYAGKELGPTDTPRTLGTPNIGGFYLPLWWSRLVEIYMLSGAKHRWTNIPLEPKLGSNFWSAPEKSSGKSFSRAAFRIRPPKG